MKRSTGWMIGVASAIVAAAAVAQMSMPPAFTGKSVFFRSHSSMEEQGRDLLAEAAKGNGSASVTLETYPGHFTMLTGRTKDGGAELHRRNNDVFVAVDGEATVVTGGTMVDAKDSGPDEVRGSRVDGGTSHVMHPGDVIHISPNTPHQTLVAPGKTFVYFVVKIEEPKARMMPAMK